MNLESLVVFGPVCLYLVFIGGLCWSLISIGRSCVKALKSSDGQKLDERMKPMLLIIFLWLTAIWALWVVQNRLISEQPNESRWAELLALGLVSASVLVIMILALLIQKQLRAGLSYDLTTWNLLVLRVATALLLVGGGLLAALSLPGSDALLSNLLQADSTVLPKLLQLLGIAVLVVIAVLGLISNGWIKHRLMLDTSSFRVHVSPVPVSPMKSDQPLGSNQTGSVDLETEFFFHIRNLKHEKNR